MDFPLLRCKTPAVNQIYIYRTRAVFVQPTSLNVENTFERKKESSLIIILRYRRERVREIIGLWDWSITSFLKKKNASFRGNGDRVKELLYSKVLRSECD